MGDSVTDPVDPVDLGELLVACIRATETAISVSDATSPDLPLLYVNPAFERMTGYPAAAAVGRNARFLHGPGTDPDTVRAIAESAAAGRHTQARLVHHRADGTPFWVEVRISPVHDADGAVTRFVAVHHDVSVEVSAEREAAWAAARDSLTGLLNRPAFVAHLERELSRAQRQASAVGVLFLDVDAFKAVNDTYGHLVGDGYLLHVAECLRQRLRGQDAAARVGGDEFVALLADLPGDGAASAAHVVADLRRALAGPFVVDGVEHTARVSVGTALFPRDGLTVRDLVACADADMYRGKRPPPAPGGHPGG